MTHLYRILTSLFAGLLTFALVYSNNGIIIDPIVYSFVAFLILLIFLYAEERLLKSIKPESLFMSIFGLLITLSVAYLITSLMKPDGTMGIKALLFVFLGLLGIRIGFQLSKKGYIFPSNLSGVVPGGFQVPAGDTRPRVKEKILDTSVIIDGRILDIADTHFIDGPLILPNFVLREIQLISDSSDPIKRARGRRGLDMLNKLQRKGSIEVKITYQDYTDTREVDAKLIKLSRDLDAKLVTNDFNLNKVAELQGVDVLNLNNLANALKPVVLPGEEIAIQVIKEGKDENQGIGYMEDGTMVVIENGGHLLGKDVRVGVTSIIQTAAGKMIFTKVVK
ncbi:MAG: hypothetical protein H7A25_05675 [Leptospiraceae bacterium]|nr:hypothetical protein [Leptospiraceae bacterium]MCP5499370.1 hypothetical protein [Leptospiraceae bacterium]